MSALMLTGCTNNFPADPFGTLSKVQNGVMRVGFTENQPWIIYSSIDDGTVEPIGIEPNLVSEFADQLEAEIQWTSGSEAVLLESLYLGELDLVIGGFLDDTPWTGKGAITRPYAVKSTAKGEKNHVMIVRMGENRFLVALETFLFENARS